MTWVEGKAQEKKIGTVDQRQPDPRKKQGWVPKYATLGDILAEYARAETERRRSSAFQSPSARGTPPGR